MFFEGNTRNMSRKNIINYTSFYLTLVTLFQHQSSAITWINIQIQRGTSRKASFSCAKMVIKYATQTQPWPTNPSFQCLLSNSCQSDHSKRSRRVDEKFAHLLKFNLISIFRSFIANKRQSWVVTVGRFTGDKAVFFQCQRSSSLTNCVIPHKQSSTPSLPLDYPRVAF